MFLYSWLHLSGYSLSSEQLKNFRKQYSVTPGHPEFSCALGVEATTGPLGAGIGNAVGMAAAAKHAAAKYNTKDHRILNHYIIALCGDGCLQEGVSFESMSFAANDGLDNLIVIYDSNAVTLDKFASYTQSEDHAARFQAMGWNSVTIDGHNLEEIDEALTYAKTIKNGKPTIIIAQTIIGKGIAEVQGTPAAHGETGIQYQQKAKLALGLPSDSLWHVSKQTSDFFTTRKQHLREQYHDWCALYDAWKTSNPALYEELEAAKQGKYPSADQLLSEIPPYPVASGVNQQQQYPGVATRQSASDVIQHIARLVPQYISGSADLHGSTKNYIKGGGGYGRPEQQQLPSSSDSISSSSSGSSNNKSYRGRNIYFGIREHAMGTMLNGIAYYGLHRASGATFLAFADYMRPAIRIAAMSHLPVTYILTHDSIGVGEDGPTHQPVEGVSALRVIPNLDVIRPADPEEVAGAFAASIDRKDGPTAIILTRQNVRTLSEIPVDTRRNGTLYGGYIALQEQAPLKLILLGSGSELQWCMDAAKQLGNNVRVVSMPCFERFERQSLQYKESVLPSSCTRRIAIEAGVTGLWYKYVGIPDNNGGGGKVIGTDKFGFSAPGDVVMKAFNITTQNIISLANLP